MVRSVIKPALILASALMGVSLLMSGCSSMAPDIQALAQDQANVSVHQQIAGPGWTIITDYTRANTPGAAATANSSGASAGKPATGTASAP